MELREALERIEKECGVRVRKLFEGAVSLLHNLTRNFPASEDHHASHEGGLFDHSVEVAIESFLRAKKRADEIVVVRSGTINSTETTVLREQYVLACFLAGLVHDVGKIADYEPIPDRRGWTERYFPLELKGVKGKVRRVEWRKDMSHNLISLLFLYKFLETNPALLRWDTEIYVKLAEALAFEHSPIAQAVAEENFILRVLRESDSETTAVELRREGEEKSLPYLTLLRDRILREKAVNSPRFFRVIVDREKKLVAVNASIAVDSMMEALGLNKFQIISIISNYKATDQEIVKVRMGELTLPAVIFPLSLLNLPEEYLSLTPPAPRWEVVV